MNWENAALRWWHISASRSLWWASVVSLPGVRSSCSSHLPHLSPLTAMESSPPCSDTSTSSITHCCDSSTAPSRNARISVTLCGPCLSCAGSCTRAFLNPCEHPAAQNSHSHKGLSVPLHSKMYHCFFFRGRDGTGVKGWWQRLLQADNVNSQECDPRNGDRGERGFWRGERSLTAAKQKKWNIILRDGQPLLELLFQPIAIVCQLPGQVMAALSSSGDLCRSTILPCYEWLCYYRRTAQLQKIKALQKRQKITVSGQFSQVTTRLHVFHLRSVLVTFLPLVF